MRFLNTIVCTALALTVLAIPTVQCAQAETNAKPAYVLKDVRKTEEGEIRRLAAQGADKLPVIVLFGANKAVLDKVKSAALEAERKGYGVKAILVGPTDAAPSLEIYASTKVDGPAKPELGAFASAWLVTKPINPYNITQADLVKLLGDIHKEFYPAQ